MGWRWGKQTWGKTSLNELKPEEWRDCLFCLFDFDFWFFVGKKCQGIYLAVQVSWAQVPGLIQATQSPTKQEEPITKRRRSQLYVFFFFKYRQNDREVSFLHRSILSTSSLQNYKICYLITKDTRCNNDQSMLFYSLSDKKRSGKNYLFLFVSAFERSSPVA